MGTHISTSLFRQINDTDLATYSFRSTDTFPFPLSVVFPLNGVMAAVISASTASPDTRIFDITSVLSARDVSVLNGASLHCEDSHNQSNILRIEVGTRSKSKMIG